MKKIIDSKLYNTDTAKQCGHYRNGYSSNDFKSLSETLYLKKTGEFFLAGEGGPMTKYSHPVGNMTSGGSKIIPLTYAEAKEWAEAHLTADEYEALFGAVVEDDSKATLTVYLRRDLVDRLRKEAQETGVQISALIEKKLT